MFLNYSIDLDVLNPTYIYCFGIGGIVIYLFLIILAIIFIKKDVDLNYVFGYKCLLYSLNVVLNYGDVLNIPQANEKNRIMEERK